MKKPEPAIEKPALRTSFAAAAALNAPIAATASTPAAPKTGAVTATLSAAPGNDAKIETAAASDWGLSLKKPRQRAKLKIVVSILLVLTAAGGYVAYTRLAENDPAAAAGADDPADNGAELARFDETGSPDADAELPGGVDPFDDRPAVRPTANARTSSSSEPRRVGNIPDAMPIANRSSSDRGPKKNPLRESLALDDETNPDDADDADARAAGQSEPELGDDASGPSLGESADVPRRLSAAGRGDSGGSRSGGQRDPSSGPRNSTRNGNPDQVGGLSDEELDDYSVAEKRTARKSKGTTGGPAISIVEAHDDFENDQMFGDFVPQDVTTRRATSKTVVVRSTDADRQSFAMPGSVPNPRGAAARSADTGDDALLDEAPLASGANADRMYSNAARGATNGIQRRSSPPAPPADGRLMSTPATAGGPSRISDPTSDTYRVAPDDNFWKISRKQYGTARYFQALMRHNQKRVPDPQKLRPGTQVLTPPAAVLEERYPELIEKSALPAAPTSGSESAATRPRFEKPLSAANANERLVRTESEAADAGYFYGKTGEPLYRVGADDTLTGIAQRHLGRASRWNEIYDQNQDVLKSPDNLPLGTVIRLPGDASRLSLVPDGERRR